MPGGLFFRLLAFFGAMLCTLPASTQSAPPKIAPGAHRPLIPVAPPWHRRRLYQRTYAKVLSFSSKGVDARRLRRKVDDLLSQLGGCVTRAPRTFRAGELVATLRPGPRPLRVSLGRLGSKDADLRRCARRVLRHISLDRGEARVRLRFARGRPPPLLPVSRAAIRTQIRKHLQMVRRCYRREKKRVKPFSGRMVVEFVIDTRGRVISQRTPTPSIPPTFRACVLWAVRRMRFSAGRKTTTIRYPFVFK